MRIRAVSILFFNLIGAMVFSSPARSANMQITSPSFRDNETIPVKFSCHGANINPELLIKNVPDNTKTLALIIEDPDAPSGLFTHWIVYNIKPAARIPEASVPGEQGITSEGDTPYGGPCPPSGTHRYIFKLYALDSELDFKSPPDNKAFKEAIKGHVIEEAQLTGLFNSK